MIVSEGYSIMQEPRKNRIVIVLPQTYSSVTTTAVPMRGRRQMLTTAMGTPYYCMAQNKYVDMFHSCYWFVPRNGYSNAD